MCRPKQRGELFWAAKEERNGILIKSYHNAAEKEREGMKIDMQINA